MQGSLGRHLSLNLKLTEQLALPPTPNVWDGGTVNEKAMRVWYTVNQCMPSSLLK